MLVTKCSPPPALQRNVSMAAARGDVRPSITCLGHSNEVLKCKFYIGISAYPFIIPRHTLVAGYYVVPSVIRPSVRLHHFRSITSICSWIFFKFCIHIVIGDEWYGIVDGQNWSILTELLPLFILEKQFWRIIP